jgi:uncharacterized membrane protein
MRNLEWGPVSNEPGGNGTQQQEQPPHSQQNSGHSTALPPRQDDQWSTSGPSYQQYPGPVGGGGPSQVGSLAPNVAAMLSYLLFGWIGGLIMYLTQRDREVRFHAAQSILTFGGLNIICWGAWTIMWGVEFVSFFAGSFLFAIFFCWIISLLSFALWIFLSVQGYQLKHTKLHVVGAIAERWAVGGEVVQSAGAGPLS